MKRKSKYLIITPPMLITETFYIAGPILVGQLISAGYDAKNLDLNIKFFRKILTKEYIEKTEKLLKAQKKKYDSKRIKYLKNECQHSIEIYSNRFHYPYPQEEVTEAENVIESVLKFISEPYPFFYQDNLTHNFENAFGAKGSKYEDIKELTNDEKNNIFIDFFKETVEKIREEKIDFVGITIPFKGTLVPALTLARMLKANTDAYVVLGGNMVSERNINNHSEILGLFCDALLTGAGEIPIIELAESFKTPSKYKNVHGLVYKDKRNKIHFNEKIAFTDMEKLAPMSFEGIEMSDYIETIPGLYMVLSKSCYWGKCLFCSSPKYKRYNIKSPQKVVAELKDIRDKYYNGGYMFVLFQDDALPPPYLDKLADEILKEKLNIQYFIFARFEKTFTKELLEKLGKSGLKIVFWGLESGCENTLKAMNKGISLEPVPNILKYAYEAGIDNSVALIVNYPKETLEDFHSTVNFIRGVKPYIKKVVPGQFVVLRNSYIEKHPEEFGLTIYEDENLEFDYVPSWVDNNISQEERQRRWDEFCEFLKEDSIGIEATKDL